MANYIVRRIVYMILLLLVLSFVSSSPFSFRRATT